MILITDEGNWKKNCLSGTRQPAFVCFLQMSTIQNPYWQEKVVINFSNHSVFYAWFHITVLYLLLVRFSSAERRWLLIEFSLHCEMWENGTKRQQNCPSPTGMAPCQAQKKIYHSPIHSLLFHLAYWACRVWLFRFAVTLLLAVLADSLSYEWRFIILSFSRGVGRQPTARLLHRSFE